MTVDPYLLADQGEPLNMVQAAFEAFGLNPTDHLELWNALYNGSKKALQNGTSPYEVYPNLLEQARQIANPGVAAVGPRFGGDTAGTGGGTAAGGSAPTGGLTYNKLSEYLSGYQTRGLIQQGAEGSPYIVVKNDSGKTVAAWKLDSETGQYYPVNMEGGGGSGGVGGGGGGGTSSLGASAGAAGDLAGQQKAFDRQILENDRTFNENTRQFNQNFGENQRQFNTTNQRLNLSDTGQLGLGLGNLNLEQQKYIGEILSKPADFLQRAFTQRGGKSPFPEITQADLINKLSTEFDRIRGFTGGEMNKRIGNVAPTPFAPAAAPAAAQPRIPLQGAPISQTGYPGMASIAGGTPAQQNYNPAGGMPENPANFGAIAANAQSLFKPDASGQQFDFKVDDSGTLQAIPRAEGTPDGPVRDRISLVGDDPGNPQAKPELLINHGDGSFDIMNNEQTKQVMGGQMGAGGRMDMSKVSGITVSEHSDGTKNKRTMRFKMRDDEPKGYRKGTVANDREPGYDTGIGDDNALWKLSDIFRELAASGSRDRIPLSQQEMPGASYEGDLGGPTAGFVEDAKLDPSQVKDRRNAPKRAAGYSHLLPIPGYAGGTLSDLNPDVMGRMSLFDTAAVPQTTQSQLLANAQLATPTGVAQVANGQSPNTLDVTKGSSFKLFSPQQYMSLTPDEQAALSTRLASENKSLGDFLYSSQKNFAGRPRQQRRARFDVTA